MPSKRWWTVGGPMPAQRLVCFVFVNPRGVAGSTIQALQYWEVCRGHFAWEKQGMENKNQWDSVKMVQGALSQCQLLHANPSIHQWQTYTYHTLCWVLSDQHVMFEHACSCNIRCSSQPLCSSLGAAHYYYCAGYRGHYIHSIWSQWHLLLTRWTKVHG